MDPRRLRRMARKALRSRSRARAIFGTEYHLDPRNMTSIGGWKRTLSELCHKATSSLWGPLALSLIAEPGEAALEAAWTLGGEHALKLLVRERWKELKNRGIANLKAAT